MDDMDAFLDAQKEYDPTGDSSNPAAEQPASVGDEEEEYDPSAVYSSHPDQDEQSSSNQSAEMAESAVNTPDLATEGRDQKPPQAESAAPTPSKQPRTMGGFVVESEDDEDEVPESKPQAAGSASLNANGVSASPQRSLTHTPNNALPQTNVPLHSAQDLGHSGVSSSTSAALNDAAPVQSPVVPNGGTPVPDVTKSGVSDVLNAVSARPSATPVTPIVASLPKARLPQDRVGIFEDRIAEDPRGDIDAWLSLIEEHRRRHKYDEARAVYDRFFYVFPSAAEQWAEFVNMELELDELKKVERIFERSITGNPHVGLWSTYINYIRRVHNVTTDEARARPVITSVYEFVLAEIGIDIHSGKIWQDYLEFIKSGPGVLGVNSPSWQDMQKADSLRKVYQRAIAVPTNATLEIWREYDKFELTYFRNNNQGRKNLQDHSPYYMQARTANNVLEGFTRGIIRTTMPKLPPVQGFDGYEEYMQQIKLWKHWIQWEKDDPLVLKEVDRAQYNKRILYLYKQALMALRFWPELWYDAAEWCFENDLEEDGEKFLAQGIDANPESCLLAFKQAHQIELKGDYEEGDAGAIKRGAAVRAPFDKVLTELYELTNKTKKREEQFLARAKEAFAAQQAADEAARATLAADSDDDDDDDVDVKNEKRRKEKEEAHQVQLKSISAGFAAQTQTLKKTLTYAWIALMRAMRRIQGKGRPDPPAGQPAGFRGIFAESRKKGKLLSDAYVASALIEHHCYQDPAATKIFERGLKLFPDDEHFALEYIKHLIKINDLTNARAVFETVINRLTSKPEAVPRAKSLFVFLHEFESQFGDLAQIVKLEKRMSDLFPEDPQLARFASRFTTEAAKFDPTSVRPIISYKSQMKPANLPNVVPTIEEPAGAAAAAPPPPQLQQPQAPPAINSPRVNPALLPISNSPKRPFDDVDNELDQPRKMVRGESPLKGAAGRRLDAARRNMARPGEGTPNASAPPPPARLPQGINFLLGIIPGAQHYRDMSFFNPEKLTNVLRGVDLNRADVPGAIARQQQYQQQHAAQQQQVQAPTPAQPPQFGQPVPQMSQWGPPPPGGIGGYFGR